MKKKGKNYKRGFKRAIDVGNIIGFFKGSDLNAYATGYEDGIRMNKWRDKYDSKT